MNAPTPTEPDMQGTPLAQASASDGALPRFDAAAKPPAARAKVGWYALVALLSLLVVLLAGALWQKVERLQKQLLEQTAQIHQAALQARTTAQQAQENVLATAAQLALLNARLNDVATSRGELDDLLRNMARARDDNLLADVDALLRWAQQQTQLSGDAAPLVAALKSAEQRLSHSPRFKPLQQAVARDLERLAAVPWHDLANLAAQFDALMGLADNLTALSPAPNLPAASSGPVGGTWWQQLGQKMQEEWQRLVRVSRIEPSAVALLPEQVFFSREMLKWRLLHARSALLMHQWPLAQADLAAANAMLANYFDASAPSVKAFADLLQDVRARMQNLQLPTLDHTLAALDRAASGS
jgi:uroporphyrin-3 C-methyltransferase